MKLYIVTETNAENNLLLRSWVCFKKAEAEECLRSHYELACSCNRFYGKDDPIDCLDYDYFFWRLNNGMELKYSIEGSKSFK